MSVCLRSAVSFLFLALIVYSPGADAQTLSVFAGDGQIVQESMRSSVPLVVRALDGTGQPMAGVPVTWTVQSDKNWSIGAIVRPETVTDADGLARGHFVAAIIDDFSSIVPGQVIVSSPIGSATFKITTAIFTTSNGFYAPPPLVQMIKPILMSAPYEGAPGTVIRDAVAVRVTVQSGSQAGELVPNVGVEIVSSVNPLDPIPVSCDGPAGIAFTGADGVAHCDLILGSQSGTWKVAAYVGSIVTSYQFQVIITGDGDGSGGDGGSGGEPTPLAITSSTTLPSAYVGVPYSAALLASGGQPPYRWTANGALPNGLQLDPSTGLLSGEPSTGGTVQFTVTLSDDDGDSKSKSFTLVVNSNDGPPDSFTITNSNLPNGVLGQEYRAPVLSVGGCVTPFNPGQLVVSAGSLPPGLEVSGAAIRGTPTQAGGYQFTLTAIDTCQKTASKTLTITVAGAGGELPTPRITASHNSLAFQVWLGVSDWPARALSLESSGAEGFSVATTTLAGGDWLEVTPTGGSAPTTLSVGIVDTGLLNAGVYSGEVIVTPTAPGSAATLVSVTLEVVEETDLIVSPLAMAYEISPGIPPPTEKVITVSSTGVPVEFIVYAFTESGEQWLFARALTQVTPASVYVAVNGLGLEPGIYRGTVVVQSPLDESKSIEVPVTLEIPQPKPSIAAMQNAASFQEGPVSPGEIVVIYGSKMGPPDLTHLALGADGRLTTDLAGTRVFFGQTAAPMIYTWHKQVSAIVPYIAGSQSTTTVRVEYRGAMSQALEVDVAPAAPGVFRADQTGQGAIINQNRTYNSADNPAPKGSTVSIYVTGEGMTIPASVDGMIHPSVLPLPEPMLPVRVLVGGIEAEWSYAGSAPASVAGLMQINVKIPDGVGAGPVPVLIMIGDYQSQEGIFVSVMEAPPPAE